jgi:hypothetical protein
MDDAIASGRSVLHIRLSREGIMCIDTGVDGEIFREAAS